MNTLEISVIEIIVEPYQREDGKWETTIVTDCWGHKQKETIVSEKRWMVERYEVGYTWLT